MPVIILVDGCSMVELIYFHGKWFAFLVFSPPFSVGFNLEQSLFCCIIII